jgi:HAD superfamily hydrolase (TIGR01490 family)
MVETTEGSGAVAAFFDVDRTVVVGSSMLALAGPLRRAGLVSWGAALTASVRGLEFSLRGFSDEEVRAAVRAIGATVRGLEVEAMRRVAAAAIPRVLVPRVYPEAVRLMAWHRHRGHLVFLVSAATHELIDRLGEILQADGVVGSEAEVADGRYTGRVLLLCHGGPKAEAVRRLAEGRGIDLARSFAYGDGIGDLAMLAMVGHPRAVNPDRRLRAEARRRGWHELHFRRRRSAGWLPRRRRPETWPAERAPWPASPALSADAAAGAVALGEMAEGAGPVAV